MSNTGLFAKLQFSMIRFRVRHGFCFCFCFATRVKRRKTSGTRVTIHPRPATIRFSRENLKRCLITKEPNIKNCGWMENESAKCEVWKIRSMAMRSVENEEYGK